MAPAVLSNGCPDVQSFGSLQSISLLSHLPNSPVELQPPSKMKRLLPRPLSYPPPLCSPPWIPPSISARPLPVLQNCTGTTFLKHLISQLKLGFTLVLRPSQVHGTKCLHFPGNEGEERVFTWSLCDDECHLSQGQQRRSEPCSLMKPLTRAMHMNLSFL